MICQLLLMLSALSGATSQIAGGAGATARLQAAIDACPAEGCVLELPDPVYPLSNRLWIEGKDNLKIVGTGATRPVLIWDDSLLTPDSAKIAAVFRLTPPTGGGRPKLPKGWLMWPYAYKSGVGTATDLSVDYSTTGYQHNGMVMIKNSKRVVLEGLTLDGRKSACFWNDSVWDGKYSLFFGSLGVSLLRSLAVDIRDCEILHFWSAVYINDRNPSCQAWSDLLTTADVGAKPWTACGTMGGHLIERNRIHANWWAVYSETEWDQGSTIRENLAWNNVNQGIHAPSEAVVPARVAMFGGQRYVVGGFLYTKDMLMPAHVVTHNTIYSSTSPSGFDLYRYTGTALWSDNIIQIPDSIGQYSTKGSYYHALDDYYASGNHVWNNTLFSNWKYDFLESQSSAWIVDSSLHYKGPVVTPRDTIAILKNGKIVDSIAYDTVIGDKTCAAGCDLKLTTPLALPYYMSTPWSLIWPVKSYEVQVKGPDSLVHTERVSETTMDSAFQVSYAGQDTATSLQHANWLCRFCPFTSLDSSSADFLVPDSSSKLIKASLLERDTVGGHRGAIGAGGALGRHVPVRLRARGMPQFSGSTLRLPVSISSETKLDGMAVRRIQVTYRDLDDDGKCFIPEYAANVKLSAVQPFQPTDTVISIAMSPSSNVVYQVDLWPVGISGSDTVAATPVVWTWTSVAKAGSFQPPATGISVAKKPVRIRFLSGSDRKMLLIQGFDEEFLTLADAAGRHRQVATQVVPGGRTAQLRGIPAGIWFVRLPEGSQRLLIAP